MVPFRYIEFYDVPRCLALRYQGKLLLLQSAFDEQLDDYPKSYSIYLLPESTKHSLAKNSWDFLTSTPMTPLGNIPIDTVNFDPTKRHSLDPACLNGLPI